MVYITKSGAVQEQRTGIVAMLLAFLYALLEMINVFVNTLISPEGHQAAMAKKRDDRNGPGGGGKGPRITGVDKIQGGGGSAQCQTGG